MKPTETTATTLTGAQEAVLAALLQGQTQRDAAAAGGVNEATVSRWLAGDAMFITTLNRRRRELWEQQRDALANLRMSAFKVLRDAMNDGDPRLQVQAATAILRAIPALSEPMGETDPAKLTGQQKQDARLAELLNL